jgi:hypothetical protein
MKTCSKCHFPKIYFPRDSSRKDGLSYICSDCTRSKNQKYSVEHRDIKMKSVKSYKIRSRQKDSISNLVYNGTTQQLLNEIQKCEVVCAICHRTRTNARLLEQKVA